ncbi:MAG: ABC transporter permease subunit, partial [Pseudomonadota bacterium]
VNVCAYFALHAADLENLKLADCNQFLIASGCVLISYPLIYVFEKMFGFPQRGLVTILFGHTVLGMAYATVVVESRLQEMSKSLTEAAMDLGCKPYQVFGLVTLPNITQALASAWLLTFTLS